MNLVLVISSCVSIDILKTDIVRTMKLLRCDSVEKLNRSFITFPSEWEGL